MRVEQPDKGRAQITPTETGFELVIPTRKNWFIILFVGFWLCGWALGELTVLAVLVGGEETADAEARFFMLIWLLGWTVGGVFALGVFLWSLGGKEVAVLHDGVLTLTKEIPVWRRSKAFALHDIGSVRVVPMSSMPLMFPSHISAFGFFNGYRHGTVQFDFGRGMRAFGAELSPIEAEEVADLLRKHLPD